MAEVSNEEFYNHPNSLSFDLDSLSPPNNSSNPNLFDDYAVNLGFNLHAETETLGSDYGDTDCFFYGGEEEHEEQMNFVSDLFESREIHAAEDPIWGFDSDHGEDAEFELGFGPGLRVVDMDSESDSEQFEVNSGFINNDDIDNYGRFVVGDGGYVIENDREEFEWEEVNDRENLNYVIERIEEISVSSDISSSLGEESRLIDDDEIDEHGTNVGWEVLLTMNNLERNLEFEIPEENNLGGSEAPRINIPEDYVLSMEYDALFGQLVENENALKGSPPAAKSVVENLPSLVLTMEEMGENNSAVTCAVCKDEAAIGDEMTKMPCCHFYHGECILPWLKIRNTCPVCRYELPTDDADYEKRKRERGNSRVAAPPLDDEYELRYNFELLL